MAIPMLSLIVILSARSAAPCMERPPFEVQISNAAFVGEVTIEGAHDVKCVVGGAWEGNGRVCHAEVLDPIKGDLRRLSFFAYHCGEVGTGRPYLLLAYERKPRLAEVADPDLALQDRLRCIDEAPAEWSAEIVPFVARDAGGSRGRRWLEANHVVGDSARLPAAETIRIEGVEDIGAIDVSAYAWDDVLALIRELAAPAP
jgi:hypothetical protein